MSNDQIKNNYATFADIGLIRGPSKDILALIDQQVSVINDLNDQMLNQMNQ